MRHLRAGVCRCTSDGAAAPWISGSCKRVHTERMPTIVHASYASRGDHVLDSLEETGLLTKTKPLHVDVLKVPHHRSSRNLDRDFFERIHADVYVFSACGMYGNPDRETLEMLMDARGRAAAYDIVLTYDVKTIDAARKAEHARADKDGNKPWNAKLDSLASLIG